jgi:glutathione S-transferase
VAREDRAELEHATGQRSIPVLVAGGQIIAGEQAILAYLNTHYDEPPDASEQRPKAATAKQKELEHTCPKLPSATQ